jgi:hypothetical protein
VPPRPTVSVIVPFTGTDGQLNALVDRLSLLSVAPGDELIIADNRAVAEPGPGARELPASIWLHPAGAVASPGFARNRGAAASAGEWMVFIDADTDPDTGLLDAYFRTRPAPDTGLLAGAIIDVLDPDRAASLTARHAVARSQMSQRQTLARGHHPYTQSANVAVRSAALIAAGGFDEHARAGEDADLSFRLAAMGWRTESRPEARVRHPARATFGAALLQLAVHGSGAAWCERRHPGSFPPPSPRQLARRLAHSLGRAVRLGLGGDRQNAQFALLEVPEALAFELGRAIPNRPRWRLRA